MYHSSTDDNDILTDTVLDLIGEGLQLIFKGRRFVVNKNAAVTFSGSEGAAIFNCPINVNLAGDLKFYAQMSGRE